MAVLVTRVNRLGIPALRSINASLTDDRLTITFAPHANMPNNFQGLFLVKLDNVPPAPTGADPVPVYLLIDGYLGSEKQLFTPQGTPVTSAETVDGVYLCFYDATTGLVRVMM